MSSINVSASHSPLNVTSRMVWITISNQIELPWTQQFLCTNFLPCLLLHTLLIDTVKIFANTFHLSSKCSHKKRSFFHELFLTVLTHQHHLVESYLIMAKTALEISQVITSSLGVTYNINVRHTKLLMLNTVLSHVVYKSFFDQVNSGVHCRCRWCYFAYTLGSFLNNLLFSVLPSLWPWTNHWGNGSTMLLYCNCTCKSSSTLIVSSIFASLASSSKTKWKCDTLIYLTL